MKAQKTLFAAMGVAVLFLGTTACGRDNNQGAADRVDDAPAATADRTADMDTDWMKDRDEYINKRQEDLTKVEQRWDDMQNRASTQAKNTWKEMKQETLDIRRELNEAKNSVTKQDWEATKDRMDKRWENFEDRAENLFTGNVRR